MPEILLADVCRPANMAAAWERFARGNGIWAAGVALQRIARSPVGPLLELVEELRSGSYRPRKPSLVSIAKGDGTRRTLTIFPVRDRVAQRAVLQVVQRVTEEVFLPASCGFRPGRGVALALQQAREWIAGGFRWVADADVRECFASMPHDSLLERVTAILPDRSLLPLITLMIKSGAMAVQEAAAPVGIAQGSCLSPWLCNVYLHALDAEMAAHGIPLVRYADDLLAFGFSQVAAARALDHMRQALEKLHLEVHPGKSRIARVEEGVRFLGGMLSVQDRLPPPSPAR